MSANTLAIFDGNALIHRAYHALPPLTIKSGEVVNAVYGFSSMLLKILKDLEPEYCAVAFDRKAPTFRHEIYTDYKANRPATPDDLVSQIERTRELVRAFDIPVFEMDGYEADDVLGTLSRQALGRGAEVIIVTGDADSMQLVRPGVKVLYPKSGRQFSDTRLYDEEAVKEKFGVPAEMVADYKAIVGDPSDNIPGVPGIGPKTAEKLLNDYKSIEKIYDNLDTVRPEKLRLLLASHEGDARRGKKLATIVTDMPISLDLEACRLSCYDRGRVLSLFQELEFSSLISKLPPESAINSQNQGHSANPPAAREVVCEYSVVGRSDQLEALVAELETSNGFAFDAETTGLDLATCPVVGLSFSVGEGKSYYIPIGHIGWEQIEQLSSDEVARALKPVMENPKVPKTAHNAKFDMDAMSLLGINVKGVAFDTMIAAYLLGEKSLGLKELAFNRLGVEMTPLSDLIGKGRRQINMSQVEVSEAYKYACADSDMTGRLREVFELELKNQGLDKLFNQVEMPLLPILLGMEKTGIILDIELLGRLSRRLARRLIELEAEIYNYAGHRFNINSTRQLGQVLFEEIRLTGAKKTKSGYSTDAGVLESLRGAHPMVDLVIEFRQLAKLKSTYVDALPGLVNPATGRLHTSFNQTRTATGRLSSSDPNLQNIPVRGELGREIRQACIASPGSVLLSGDYSQIDLRVLAHLSGDPALRETFERNEDVHTATAMELFSVTADRVKPDMRRLAKTVNFGVIYGMSGYGLEQATEFNRQEAESFIQTYFARYPGVRNYLEETKDKARTTGYVETLLGRRRLVPEVHSPNRNIREAAERMAINMPVQGTSADIIKVAMIDLDRQIESQGLTSRMLLQVHDELIFEVPSGEIQVMSEMVPRLMSQAVKLDVPLKVDIKTGTSWGQVEG